MSVFKDELAERTRLYREGRKLWAEGTALVADGRKLMAQGQHFEGNRLIRSGGARIAEAERMHAAASIERKRPMPARPAPSVFDGDGRRKVEPIHPPGGTAPQVATKAQARMLIADFTRRGLSRHHAPGQFLWVIVTHCTEQGMRYEVRETHLDGRLVGYVIEAIADAPTS